MAVLWDSANPGSIAQRPDYESSALSLDVKLEFIETRTANDLEQAFSAVKKVRAEALVTINSPHLSISRRERRRRHPVYAWKTFRPFLHWGYDGDSQKSRTCAFREYPCQLQRPNQTRQRTEQNFPLSSGPVQRGRSLGCRNRFSPKSK